MAEPGSQNPLKRNKKSEESTFADVLEEFNMSVPTYPYKSSSDYAAAVNKWLWQCYHWQCFTMTFSYLASKTALSIQSNSPYGSTDFNRNFPNQTPALQQNGRVYQIPSLCKRLLADFIDIFFHGFLKMAITIIAVTFFDMIYISQVNNLEKIIRSGNFDYSTAMEVASEIYNPPALEILNTFAICIFEAVFTHKRLIGGGGATLGKRLMKIKVVSCKTVTQLDANTICVYPAGDLGLGWGFMRAFIKHFSYQFFLPTMCFLQYNRTAYDHICGSIVVKDPPQRPNRN